MEIIINKSESIGNILKSSGTSINDKYFYLPYWFEEVEDSDVLIVHKLGNNLPKELTDAINSFREEIK